jgi:hypothetical protein
MLADALKAEGDGGEASSWVGGLPATDTLAERVPGRPGIATGTAAAAAAARERDEAVVPPMPTDANASAEPAAADIVEGRGGMAMAGGGARVGLGGRSSPALTDRADDATGRGNASIDAPCVPRTHRPVSEHACARMCVYVYVSVCAYVCPSTSSFSHAHARTRTHVPWRQRAGQRRPMTIPTTTSCC